MVTCPAGDQSTDPEFCSVCGVEISPGASGAGTGAAAGAGETVCPVCGMERRPPDARFCGTCRYDFKLGVPGPPPVAAPTVAPSAPEPAVTAPEPPLPTPAGAAPDAASSVATGPRFWEAVVAVDPGLDAMPDPATPPPTNEPERTFPINQAESMIGRRDEHRGIVPEIMPRDPGVSRRHAMVYRFPDDSLAIADLGSANGTLLNGIPLLVGVKTSVQDGDTIQMGRWTRITFRTRKA